jgi:hypothetical protein
MAILSSCGFSHHLLGGVETGAAVFLQPISVKLDFIKNISFDHVRATQVAQRRLNEEESFSF